MTGYRRLPILAIAAVLAAGCGASPASSVPASAATAVASMEPTAPTTPAPTDAPTPTTGPTATALPAPADGCAEITHVDMNHLDVELSSVYPSGSGGLGGFSIGLVYGRLQVTRMTELSGQQRSAVPPPRVIDNGRGLVLGGREFTTFPSFDRVGETQAIVDARASLAMDGSPPIELSTRIVPGNRILNQAAVTVPDVAGAGSVTLRLTWTDDCFRYDATGTIPVDVLPFRATANCELDERLYWEDLHEFLQRSITVGTAKPAAGSAFNESKFAPYVSPGIDAFIGYMFDRDAPEQTVAPGSTLRLEGVKPGLHLARNLTLVTWTRRSIAAAVEGYPPNGMVEVINARLERGPDGSFELPVPDDPGRYVAAVSVRFDSPCTTGTLWSVVNIEVA